MSVATTRCTGHKSAAGAQMEVPLLETVMIKIPALQMSLRAWLLEGPLSAHVPAYVARLRLGGYAPHTCERNLNALTHGCRRSSAFAWPMSCSTARHVFTCMAKGASS